MAHPLRASAALLLATGLAVVAVSTGNAETTAHKRHHRHHAHRPVVEAPAYAPDDAAGVGYGTNNSGTSGRGYVYNGSGFGRFVPGPDGSFGGYPAGSAGAEELMNQQRIKCEAVPEEC